MYNKNSNYMKSVAVFIMLFISLSAFSQNSVMFKITEESGEPIIGATIIIKDKTIGTTTDSEGFAILKSIPNGKQTIQISFIGFETVLKELDFPLSVQDTIKIEMEEDEKHLEQVIVTSTRSSRTIEVIPTRIEAIALEELTEKSAMNSTNIAMLFRESTGIQVQQTSANSANSSIRIQGLDGRYTQILKDGFPLYGEFSGGLSIMQIPPLDLRQVEIIKGSNSTLYGGGAIAGLINLVTKKPENERQTEIMFNQTSALGSTLNAFYAQRFGKFGFSLYSSANYQKPYDVDKDDFSELPLTKSLTINPKLFYYFNDNTDLMFGLNTTFDDRNGGDLHVINGNSEPNHVFYEQNISKRFSTQLEFNKLFSKNKHLSIRNSVGYFDRTIKLPNYTFTGNQISSFSELHYCIENEKSEWNLGANLYTDKFSEIKKDNPILRNYENLTSGIFAQNLFNANEHFIIETGFRADYNLNYGFFPLPRLSVLYKVNKKLSMRLGGGLGYKIPTIFTEDAEILSYQNIEPINQTTIKAEKSIGGNFDFNYKFSLFDKVFVSLNQLFFYTQLNNSMVLRTNDLTNNLLFENANGAINTQGTETNLKFSYNDFKLFIFYTFTDTKLNYNNINKQKPLTPKHNFGAVLFYEVEEKWNIGLEGYYTGQQYRNDFTETKPFWRLGFMVRRNFEKISLFVNFENFTDTRQSRFEQVVIPPTTSPTFRDIYAPTEGFVANGGIIIKL